MASRTHQARCARVVRLLAAGVLVLTLAACDKCGDFIFSPHKSQVCKGETVPR